MEKNMNLRKYKSGDCSTLAELFYNTVHTINAKDYTDAQLAVWATGNVDLSTWDKSFLEHDTIVAEENGTIVGFGVMDDKGYLDRLYVHKDYQGQGVATAILSELEKNAVAFGITDFNTHASITAKPFFEKCGYHAVRENTVFRGDVKLTNYIMVKNHLKWDILVREAEQEDYPAICELIKKELGYAQLNSTEAKKRLSLFKTDKDWVTFVAVLDHKTVGFIGVMKGLAYEIEGYYAKIMALAVSADFQRHGIGTLLLHRAEQWARNNGIRSVTLNSSFHRLGAHEFYEQNGYAKKRYSFVKTLK
jgi:putative acetyltransferase